MGIDTVVDLYVNLSKSCPNHRYTSWDNCFQAFSTPTQHQYHSLELAFYLASWGMYRGSSGLLQKNHNIHEGAIDILFSHEAQNLKCSENKEINDSDIEAILKIKTDLENHYSQWEFVTDKGEKRTINPTNTLISKIMLGTLGCVPAYDRFFLEGLKKHGFKHQTFNQNSLAELLLFVNLNSQEIQEAQKDIKTKTGNYYPKMKIVDMYFWQLGFEIVSK